MHASLNKKTWIPTNRCGRTSKRNGRESNHDDFQERHCRRSGTFATECRSDAGSEATIHTMRDIFANEETEAILITESRKCIYLHQSKGNVT